MALTDNEKTRYDRQIILAGVGEEGQEKLKRSKVFIAGCGGLGSPIAEYLAAAGIGEIVMADQDRVELSNLNRQIIHFDNDIGREKTLSALEKLKQLNPFIDVKAFTGTIDNASIDSLVDGCDVILDALDNFDTRYILNRASIKYKVPLIYGSIWGLEGRASTFIPGMSPCLECVFPHGPAPEKFPVLGTTPGVIGTIQATECIKLLLGLGKPLLGRLLIYDGEYMEFSEIKISRNPKCKACSRLYPGQ